MRIPFLLIAASLGPFTGLIVSGCGSDDIDSNGGAAGSAVPAGSTDDDGATGVDSTTVTACGARGCRNERNHPPTASAGANQQVVPGATVTLQGNGTDPEGATLAFAWQQIAGPQVELSDASAAQPTFVANFPSRTRLTFMLKVADPVGLIDVAVTNVDVNAARGVAKHVILLIADGTPLESEMGYSQYRYGTDNGASWHSWPYRGFVTTWDTSAYNRYAYSFYSANPYDAATFDPWIGYNPLLGGSLPSPLEEAPELTDYFLTPMKRSASDSAKYPYPDSASTATALATGIKTEDGNIAWLPGDPADGRVKTIAEKVRAQRGSAIGVISTVPFTHATPAAFTGHNPNRSDSANIGTEILTVTQPDVVMGAGHPDFLGTPPNYKYVSAADLTGLRAGTGPHGVYQFVERVGGTAGDAALASAVDSAIVADKKLCGLFGGDASNKDYLAHPIPSDTPGSPAVTLPNTENPSLAAMTTESLRLLAPARKATACS